VEAAVTQHIGIIDLGSNTARMIIVQYQPHHSFKLVDEVKENVRLAHDVGDDNVLQEQPMQWAIETLKMFVAHGRAMNVPTIVAVATSAVRDAANQATFLAQVHAATGIELRVLTGEEEAYYGYLGVVNSLPLQDGFIFDIGGGSVELALVRGRGLASSISLPLGTVRLTERFFRNDPPSKSDLKALDKYLDAALDKVDWFTVQGAMQLVGVGGTVRNLAKIDQRLMRYPIDKYHGYHIPLERVEDWAARLSKMNRAERDHVEGLNSDRADVIVAGILLIRKLMRRVGAASLWISGQGLRDGLFYEHFLVGSTPPLITNLRLFATENLARLYDYHVVHAVKVRDLSLSLFDQLSVLHGYGVWERDLLSAAAIIHDIGVAVNYYDHHKHGLYLILNAALSGFSHREIALIGLLARHHRKGSITDEGLGGLLEPGDLERATKLSALLRIAEYLERSKSQVIQNVRCVIEKGLVRVVVDTVGDATVEIWDTNRRTGLFRKAYGLDIIVE
jgi:exopolyphosphatase/guanosine-5'-triphosphate,3'-diphosphate pyrophosphatase